MNTELVHQVGGLDTRLANWLCKKINVAKSKEVKTGCNLAESFKEGYDQKGAVFLMTTTKEKRGDLYKNIISC
jgi:hypothetical protein